MAREVGSLQQLFEVIRQANGVELDDAASELLDTTWVHVSVDVVISVQEIEPKHNLVRNVKNLLEAKVLLAEGFPVRNRIRRFHFNEYKRVRYDPVLFDWNEILVLEALECLNHLKCASAFLLVQSRNVDAGDHFVHSRVLIAYNENLTVSFAEVE